VPYKDRDKQREFQRNHLAKKRALAIRNLGGKCTWCGSTDRLEFDHIDPTTKVCSISGLWSYRWEVIQKELVKCWLLCFNCHRIKTRDDLPEVPHGTHTRYVRYHCRCRPCKDDHARVNAKYRG
jgi:5-methylcytosine-specific restriction endonuclease McrA